MPASTLSPFMPEATLQQTHILPHVAIADVEVRSRADPGGLSQEVAMATNMHQLLQSLLKAQVLKSNWQSLFGDAHPFPLSLPDQESGFVCFEGN